MKFAHLADCHLGAWGTHPDLRELPLKSLETAVKTIIEERLDFVLIAGDFFDSSMPAVDVMRFAVEQLMRLKLANIPVYAVAGSHDYSPTGKTMLSVLEAADLIKNAHMKWLEDKSGARIFGMEGLRGGLESENFKNLSIEPSEGYNIFMFHSAVNEISGMEGIPLARLPRGFDYYAAGHVHTPAKHTHENGTIVFPGPLFPAEFGELEKLSHGAFCTVTVENGDTKIEDHEIRLAETKLINIDCNGKSPQEIESAFSRAISESDVDGAIILLKAKGTLASGKPTDINWRAMAEKAQSRGAIAVKRSVHLDVKENEITKSIEASGNLEQIEKVIIEKNAGKESAKVMRLMDILSIEKAEDEKTATYEEKIKLGIRKIFGF